MLEGKVISANDVQVVKLEGDIKIRFTEQAYEVQRHGAWIDLRSVEDYEYKKGDFFYINLGVNIKVPKGYEGLLAPRSSMFKNYGLIQTNSVGVIEDNYCGNNDVWMLPVYALKDGKITKGDRLCQFRTLKSMGHTHFTVVDDMEDCNRGGLGSTGKK